MSKGTEVQIQWEWKNAIGFGDIGATCDLGTVLCRTGGYQYLNILLGPN